MTSRTCDGPIGSLRDHKSPASFGRQRNCDSVSQADPPAAGPNADRERNLRGESEATASRRAIGTGVGMRIDTLGGPASGRACTRGGVSRAVMGRAVPCPTGLPP
jgi:hypothetical protein